MAHSEQLFSSKAKLNVVFCPQYLEDFNECKTIMGYRYPETLVEEFLALAASKDKDTKILDLACGPGNVAFLVRTLQSQAIF